MIGSVGRSIRRSVRGGVRRAKGGLVGSLTRVRTDRRMAALTFDDGPHPEFTPRLLDLLGERGAHATFFMVGRNAAEHPEIVARVLEEGHSVANHTWSHAVFPAISLDRRRRELRDCDDALGPGADRLFRPPRMLQTYASYFTARLSGFEVVAWSAQVEDWLDRTAHDMATELAAEISPGCIVLLHDRVEDPVVPGAADRSAMLEAVDGVIRSRDEYEFVTLPRLLRAGRPVRRPWFARTDDDWQ